MKRPIYVKGYGEPPRSSWRRRWRWLGLLVVLLLGVVFWWQGPKILPRQRAPRPLSRYKVIEKVPPVPVTQPYPGPSTTSRPEEIDLTVRATAPAGHEDAGAEAKKAAPISPAAEAAATRESASTEPQVSPAEAPSATTAPVVVIQVGAFKRRQAAEALRGRLQAMGYDAYIDSRKLPKLGVLHRVRLRGYQTRDDAQRQLDQLRQRQRLDGFVMVIEP